MFKLHDKLVAKGKPLSIVHNVSKSAFGVYSMFGLFSSKLGTDGVINEEIMQAVAPTDAEIQELLDAGFLSASDLIPNWSRDQQTRAQKAKLTAQASQRQKAKRQRDKGAVSEKPAKAPVKAVAGATVTAVTRKPAKPVVAAPVPAQPVVTVELVNDEFDQIVENIAAEIEEAVSTRPRKRPTDRARQANTEEVTDLFEAGELNEMVYLLEENYPRKSGNGLIVSPFREAACNWGINNILDAAEDLNIWAKRFPEREFLPLSEWLSTEAFLEDTDIFDNIVDTAQ